MNTQTIPGSAGMSALPLIVAVEDLAGAAYLGQMRALVVQRQAALGRFFADPAASAQIEAAQADLRRHVTHYLDRLIPESIGMVTTFEHAKTLVVSVRQELGARLDDDASKEVRAALITEFDKALSDADEARRLVSRELQSVTGTVGTLTRIIDEYGRQLQESERGRLAVLETDIAAASKGMTDAVEQTVKSGRKIGAQVKKLVTWIMSLFGASGDADDTPKDKQDDGDKDKDKDKPEGEKNKSEKRAGGPHSRIPANLSPAKPSARSRMRPPPRSPRRATSTATQRSWKSFTSNSTRCTPPSARPYSSSSRGSTTSTPSGSSTKARPM